MDAAASGLGSQGCKSLKCFKPRPSLQQLPPQLCPPNLLRLSNRPRRSNRPNITIGGFPKPLTRLSPGIGPSITNIKATCWIAFWPSLASPRSWPVQWNCRSAKSRQTPCWPPPRPGLRRSQSSLMRLAIDAITQAEGSRTAAAAHPAVAPPPAPASPAPVRSQKPSTNDDDHHGPCSANSYPRNPAAARAATAADRYRAPGAR